MNKKPTNTNVMITSGDSNINIQIDNPSSSSQLQKDKNSLKNLHTNVEKDITDKTKYNSVYEMQRKVDNISKQVHSYKEKESINTKEVNELRQELNRFKDMYENQSHKMGTVSVKNNRLNNEIISMKNKLAIFEKLSDLKSEKSSGQIKEILIKCMGSAVYKSEIRDTNKFLSWTQDEFVSLVSSDISNEDALKLFE